MPHLPGASRRLRLLAVLAVSTGTELLAMAGIRVVEVPELGRDGLYLNEFGIVLIDAGVSPARAHRVADWALAQAFDRHEFGTAPG